MRDETGTARPEFPDIALIPNAPRNALVWPSELHQNKFFRRQGNPNGDDTIGDFSVLKQMMTADPDLQRFLIRAYQYVIARFDIDGFRIDTLRYLKGVELGGRGTNGLFCFRRLRQGQQPVLV